MWPVDATDLGRVRLEVPTVEAVLLIVGVADAGSFVGPEKVARAVLTVEPAARRQQSDGVLPVVIYPRDDVSVGQVFANHVEIFAVFDTVVLDQEIPATWGETGFARVASLDERCDPRV